MSYEPRSLLFVSGARADRFPKAFAAGADVVCIDLEDAVQPSEKPMAREQTLRWLKESAGQRGATAAAVRLNAICTVEGLHDAAAWADSTVQLDWLMLPKVESAADVEFVAQWSGGRAAGLVALIETPRGVENAASIAAALGSLQPRLQGALMLGGADLALALNARFGWDALFSARGRLVNAARAHSLQCWDVPYLAIDDASGLLQETQRVMELGFSCKAAIHPTQIAPIHAAFAPDPEQIRWANALLDALAKAPTGAFIFEGKLVDAPIVNRAQRIVNLAKR